MSKWDQADRISDRIVDVLNDEIGNPCFSPLQLLAGQMLAFCAVASTMPKAMAPQPFVDVMNAIQRCLNSIMSEGGDQWATIPMTMKGSNAVAKTKQIKESVERAERAVECECGGFAPRVDCTATECKGLGCGRDRPGRECCARAFICKICGTRYVGTAQAPEME